MYFLLRTVAVVTINCAAVSPGRPVWLQRCGAVAARYRTLINTINMMHRLLVAAGETTLTSPEYFHNVT